MNAHSYSPTLEDQVLFSVLDQVAPVRAEKQLFSQNMQFSEYIPDELKDKDVFILNGAISYIPYNNSLVIYKNEIKDFINRGGTMIVTGNMYVNIILDSLELIHCDSSIQVGGYQTIIASSPNDPLLQETTFPFTNYGTCYALDDTSNSWTSVTSLNGKTVVGYKSMGAGRIIYIGNSPMQADSNSIKIIGNAIESSRHRWARTIFQPFDISAGDSIPIMFNVDMEETGYAGDQYCT